MGLTLSVLPHALAVCRLAPTAVNPADFIDSSWWSVTKTADELSIVLPESDVQSDEWAVETGWRALKVEGPLDFSLIGIMAGLSQTLAAAGVSIFAISTYDTDYLLIKADKLTTAVNALQAAGHTVQSSDKR